MVKKLEKKIIKIDPLSERLSNIGLKGGAAKKFSNINMKLIKHGESAMPGGKLSFPSSPQFIKNLAKSKKKLRPIEVMKDKKKFMIYDGSHRFEAAKLRGDKFIKAKIID